MANSRKKRLLAAVLAFMMVLGDLPTSLLTRSSSVYAEDQITNVEEGNLLGAVPDVFDDGQAGEDASDPQEATLLKGAPSGNEDTNTDETAEEPSNNKKEETSSTV